MPSVSGHGVQRGSEQEVSLAVQHGKSSHGFGAGHFARPEILILLNLESCKRLIHFENVLTSGASTQAPSQWLCKCCLYVWEMSVF